MARKRINKENCYTFLATRTRTGYQFQFPLVFHNNVNEETGIENKNEVRFFECLIILLKHPTYLCFKFFHRNQKEILDQFLMHIFGILYYNFFPSKYVFKLLLRRIITPYTLGLISSNSFSYKFNTGRQGKRAEEKITKKKLYLKNQMAIRIQASTD